MGGQISRLGGISADVTLNRESGAVTFSAGLGTFQMPHLNYAGGGHVARVTSGVTLSNASLRGRAQFDMEAVQAGDTANALQSLNVDRFHIDEVAARGLHYENSDYNAVVDLSLIHI